MQTVKVTLSGSLRKGNEKLRSSNMIIDHPPSGDKVVLGEWHRGIVGLVVYREQTVGLTGEFSFLSIVTQCFTVLLMSKIALIEQGTLFT